MFVFEFSIVTFILPLQSGKIKVTKLTLFFFISNMFYFYCTCCGTKFESNQKCHFYFAAPERQNKSDT